MHKICHRQLKYLAVAAAYKLISTATGLYGRLRPYKRNFRTDVETTVMLIQRYCKQGANCQDDPVETVVVFVFCVVAFKTFFLHYSTNRCQCTISNSQFILDSTSLFFLSKQVFYTR